ncbi:MAG: adenylate/guanylate cyclase domain-containing protein [Bacteroidota bacterium]
MFSPETKRNISRIIPFGLFWLIFSFVYTLMEKGILGTLDYYPATGNPYTFAKSVFVTSISAFIAGLLIGIIEIKYFHRIFIKMSFGKKILFKSIAYLAIIISFLLVVSAIVNSLELKANIFTGKVWVNVFAFFSTFAFWSVGVYMAAIIVVSQFYTEVSESIGHGVLNNFFTGKYHKAIEEERIFLFLDMNSSTTIAENLGHVKYFEMLQEYYADLSEPIIKFSGEVYQYVGDEIIVSWKLANGLQNNNCIECFFAMKASIINQENKYKERFGLLPGFKAGFHIGEVTTGEIGTIKKDIIFTGDVLNTTSRILGLCKIYKTDMLISADLVKKLQLSAQFQIKSFGENELRGRDEKIELFTIQQN